MNLDLIGINKGKITQFNTKGIYSIEDLVKFFPRRYYDFRNPVKIKDVVDGEYGAVVGTVIDIVDNSKTNGMIKIKIKDSSNYYLYIIFFNRPYVLKAIKKNVEYIFCGKINIEKKYGNMRQMVNPIEYSHYISQCKKILPVYSKINGMSDAFLLNSINSALAICDKEDYIEPELLKKYSLITYAEALRGVHQPSCPEDVDKALKRFLFDDLFVFNFCLNNKNKRKNIKADFEIKNFSKAKELMDKLPFQLTEGQRLSLREMSAKMKKGERLNYLVQGDVGCGKTLIAILLMVVAGNNGYQSALMAPTNVLAKQHYSELKSIAEPLGFNIAFITGEQTAKERRELIKGIKSGEYNMVVGTHAILSDNVEFKNLALVITDEEHRFGVIQREKLSKKSEEGIHSIVMSATPIPRSLAMCIYGDNIDIATIKSLPKGRQPIKTILMDNEEKAYEAMLAEVKKGRQGYIVCPLIEESDSDLLQGVESVEETFKKASRYFKDKGVRIGVINGKMKQNVVAEEINKFSKGEYDIIISTTIIEVGVNVPNSTIIVIKNAERFGLAQLHQLRGRVGRGAYESSCILLSDTSTENSKKKIDAMCRTTDGFEIARKDLEIRGAGDFLGVQQSGNNKYIMLVMGNTHLNEKIKKEIEGIYASPGRFNKYKSLLKLDVANK